MELVDVPDTREAISEALNEGQSKSRNDDCSVGMRFVDDSTSCQTCVHLTKDYYNMFTDLDGVGMREIASQ